MELPVLLLLWVVLPVAFLLGGFAYLTWQSFKYQSPVYFLLAAGLLAGAAHKLYGLTLLEESFRGPDLLNPRAAVLTVVYVMIAGLTSLLPPLRSERKLPKLRKQRDDLRTLWRSLPEAILLVDPRDGTVLDASDAAARPFRTAREDLIGASLPDLDRLADEQRPWTQRVLELEDGEDLKREGRLGPGDAGRPVEVRERLLTIDGERRVLVSVRDISTRKQYESELKNLSFSSQLSGLPSRDAMLDRLRTATERANRREDYRFALIVVRVTASKDPSEVAGFNVEGRLLEWVSARLKDAIREMDELAHVDDRVFAVLLEELKNPDDELIVARRIAERFEDPLEIDGAALKVEVVQGIRTAEDPADSADLLAEARQAMLEASKNPGTPYVRYRSDT